MRAPFQILAIPYRKGAECRFCVFHRADLDQYQFVAGGGEDAETPLEAAKREIKEETGLEVTDLRLRGIITFILPDWGNELTFLYTAKTDTAETLPCSEGTLAWIPKEKILDLPLWEGDRVFLPLLREAGGVFSLKLTYRAGGALAEATLDGAPVALPTQPPTEA